jgi:hypothetical protein
MKTQYNIVPAIRLSYDDVKIRNEILSPNDVQQIHSLLKELNRQRRYATT